MMYEELIGNLLKDKTIASTDFSACSCKALFFTDGSIVCFEWGRYSPQVEIFYFANRKEYDKYTTGV